MNPKQVIEAFDRAVDAGDLDALERICSPEIVVHSLNPNRPKGIAGLVEFVKNRAMTGGTGKWTTVTVVCEGEYVVQFGTRAVHWPGGPFRGFDLPPGDATRDCAFMFRVRDGKVTDRWAIRDDLAMIADLGAIRAARPSEVKHGTGGLQPGSPLSRVG